MTHKTNARLAGFMFLFYIANGMAGMVLFAQASGRGASGVGGIAQHAGPMQIAIVLSLLTCFSAVVLAVTLYAITRHVDRDLALFGFSCRLIEAVLNVVLVIASLGLMWLATETEAADVAIGAEFLSKLRLWTIVSGAIFFAAGSAIFSYLLLRERVVPNALAWLGLVASMLLAVLLPVQLVGLITNQVSVFAWLPMLAFEVTLALWLLIKGVNVPPPLERQA